MSSKPKSEPSTQLTADELFERELANLRKKYEREFNYEQHKVYNPALTKECSGPLQAIAHCIDDALHRQTTTLKQFNHGITKKVNGMLGESEIDVKETEPYFTIAQRRAECAEEIQTLIHLAVNVITLMVRVSHSPMLAHVVFIHLGEGQDR